MARPDKLVLGIENALDGATVRKSYLTATPSQQAGYAATQSLDEALGLPYRAAAADAKYTPVLYRLSESRQVGAFAGLAHNMTATGSWRMTIAEEGGFAVRPIWTTNGTSDSATTGASITRSADLTILVRGVVLPPWPAAASFGGAPIIILRDATTEVQIGWRGEAISNPLGLFARVKHNSVIVALVFGAAPFVGRGQIADLAVRYRDSDQSVSLWAGGVEIGSGTATVAYVAGGAQTLDLGIIGATRTQFAYQNVALYDAALSDDTIAGYRHLVLDGDEKDVLAAYHFLEGTGTTVADSVGAADLTLTGGTWGEVANLGETATPVYDAVGQWVRRDALRLKEAVEVTSPAFGVGASSNAASDLTLACILRVDPSHATTTSGTGRNAVTYGASLADPEIMIAVDDGELVVRSARGGPAEVNLGAIDDGVVRRVRAVLYAVDSTTSTLDVYLASGDAAEALADTFNVGPYDALATCKLFLGAPASNAHAIVSEVRLWGSRAYEIDDNASLVDPPDLSSLTLLEVLRLDGEVVSEVDPTRSYTVTGATYEPLNNPRITRPTAGRDGLGVTRAGGTQDQIARLLDVLASDVVADEIFLELWDRKQTAGIELGAVVAWSTWRPATHRVFGAPRSHARPSLKRSTSGSAYLEAGHSSDAVSMTLGYVDNSFSAKAETDELIGRVARRRQDLLVLLLFDPTVEQHLVADRSVVGVIESIRPVEDTDNYYSKTEITVSGVL